MNFPSPRKKRKCNEPFTTQTLSHTQTHKNYNLVGGIGRIILEMPLPWSWKAYFEGHTDDAIETRGEIVYKKKAKKYFFWFHEISPQPKGNLMMQKKAKGIVFNIHLFIITSPLSIITRDMLAGRGKIQKKQGKEMQKRAWDKRARKEIRE